MARRMSGTLKIIITIIAVLVGIVVVINVTGVIGDRSVSGEIEAASESAKEYFSSLKKDGEGNAWQFYSKAMEKAEGIASDRELIQYLDGDEEVTFRLMKSILDNLEIIELIKEGARQDYCALPHPYEEGMEASLPAYVSLRRAVSITCVKALYDLENGRSEEALDLLFSSMMVGKHVASSPMIIDQMIGFALVGRALQVLEIGISSRAFNSRQLEEISEFLDDMEKHWPTLANAIAADMKLMRISFAKYHENITSLMILGQEEGEQFGFARMFVLRILCWRDWFSPIKSIHSCFGFFDELHNDLVSYEEVLLDDDATAEMERERRNAIASKVDAFRERNFWFAIACPEYPSMFKRKIEQITKIRLLNISSSIASHRLETGSFPEKLQDIAPHLIVDLQTRKPWRYINYGDSATVSTPSSETGGAEEETSITITRMGIRQYLEKKRKAAQLKREADKKKKPEK